MFWLQPLVRRLWGKRGTRRLINWVIKRTAERYHDQPGKRFVIPYDGSSRLLMHPADWIPALIYWRGHHTNFPNTFLGDLITPGMTIIDVGANIGEFTLYFAKRVPQGRVIAIEPVGTNLRDLSVAVRLSGFENVEMFSLALSDRTGEGQIFSVDELYPLCGLTQQAANYSLITRQEYGSVNTPHSTCSVMTLDGFCSDIGLDCLDFIKIDVEGSEGRVLEGGKETISRFRPLLYVECHRYTLNGAGSSSLELINQLKSFGYRIYWPHKWHRSGEVFGLGHTRFPQVCDLLCIWSD